MLVLSERDVRASLGMSEALDALRRAAVAVRHPSTLIPVRHYLPIGEGMGSMLVMPAYAPAAGGMGLKSLVELKGGPGSYHAAILLLDHQSGAPQALVAATYLTNLRTGAGAGLAAQTLALPEAAVLSVLGAGGVARASIEAICLARPIRRVVVWNRTRARAEECVAQLSATFGRSKAPLEFQVMDAPRAAVAQADVVVTATSSPTPILSGSWVAPGALVCGMGAGHALAREVDEELVRRAGRLVVEELNAGLVPGDLRIPLEQGIIRREQVVELGQVLLGEAPGRERPDQIIFFKSTGLAIQDIAVARAAVERARALGLGTEVALDG